MNGNETQRQGANVSLWEATFEFDPLSPLSKNISADVCIVGAGIAGMTTAYLLVREGKSVVVLDERPVGSGMTGRTTAHLVNALDDRYFDLERYHGEEGARLAAESHTAAVDQIEEIVDLEKIECDFARVDGFLFVPPGGSMSELDRELEATLRAGIPVKHVPKAPLNSFDTGPAILFPRQAQFHPRKYLRGLQGAITKAGGQIFTGTRALEVEGGDNGKVTTKEGNIVMAKSIVIATNSPMNDRYVIHTKQAPYTTYVVVFEIKRGSVPQILLWDTAETAEKEKQSGVIPYHYIRTAPGNEDVDLLIVGGSDHKTGQADNDFAERYEWLENWTRDRFEIGAVRYRWSGQVMEPTDGLAFIGRNPADNDNVYIATGDSGNGMTHGTIAGRLIVDLINGRENAWEKLYDPSRKSLRALSDFAKENINVAARFGDYLTPSDVDSEEKIARGEGALIREGVLKAAVYRDEEGVVHRMSAVCPHLKCIVQWNGNEKTWDCPCHGSRFDCRGRVINGPSIADLAKIDN
jgi:glycine/D-amino acid oxidase-like deaminating enzyme/nitrite reductase/ring-hydroxylating ferredoxin subunit